MKKPQILGWAWRCVLAFALAASLVMAVPSAHADTGPATVADAMPCHDGAPAPAAQPPCEDSCCPEPDCDPANCRIAAPLVMVAAWSVGLPSPNAHAGPWQVAIPSAAPTGEQLRPPIA